MNFSRTAIPDVVIFEPDVYGDERGFFMETYRQTWLSDLGISPLFVQDNHSKSPFGVLRGLHFQAKNTQGKLIRVVAGEIFDVAVDMRMDSPTYGQWVGEYLSVENKKIFWVPEGFAHGFVVTSDSAEVVYKCTNLYDPASEKTIVWNDASLGISWPEQVLDSIQLSVKDQQGMKFREGIGFRHGCWEELDD